MKMTKRVNINAPIAIRNIKPPIYGRCNGIVMSTGDILKCLCKRAIVDEILPDGSTVRLNMKNYYTDNGAGLDASVNNAIKTQPQPEAAKQPTDNVADACQISDDKNQDEATKETENIPDENADIKVESAPEETVSPKDNVPDSNDTAATTEETAEKSEQPSENADITVESAPEGTASPKDTTVATEEPKNSTKAKQPANRQKASKKKTGGASKTAK